MFSDRIKKAIDKCISEYIPFVVYLKPRSADVVFFSNPSRAIGQCTVDDKKYGFAVNLFKTRDNPYFIENECDVDITLTLPYQTRLMPLISPERQSTILEKYLRNVEKIISRLKEHGGKTVFSKIVAGNTNRRWSDVINNYFNSFQNTLRFAYYIPETGFWMAASPEILIEKNNDASSFITMSLAGTRKVVDKDEAWDTKNIEEHDFVTKYIVDSLASIGITSYIEDPENLKFGNVEHLCNRIVCSFKTHNLYSIANQLNPTPALAGFPINDALNDIAKYELHNRHCYGGYVVVRDSEGFYAYVNLRCVHFDHTNYCIYGGGGITALSDGQSEWDETEAKIAKLKELL